LRGVEQNEQQRHRLPGGFININESLTGRRQIDETIKDVSIDSSIEIEGVAASHTFTHNGKAPTTGRPGESN
jgi:hypothetical protein